jgi:hypothetical protein
LNLAAAAAAITVVSMVAILAPPISQTPALLLACAVAFLFLWPGIGGRDHESARIAMLGPVGSLSLATLAGAAAALAAALSGHDALSFALDVLVIGGFVAGIALARASADTIARRAQVSQTPSIHGQWQGRVGQLAALCADAASRASVGRLAEALRYAARDLPGHASAENAQVNASIAELEQGLREKQPAAVQAAMDAIEAALARRELELKAMRSKV